MTITKKTENEKWRRKWNEYNPVADAIHSFIHSNIHTVISSQSISFGPHPHHHHHHLVSKEKKLPLSSLVQSSQVQSIQMRKKKFFFLLLLLLLGSEAKFFFCLPLTFTFPFFVFILVCSHTHYLDFGTFLLFFSPIWEACVRWWENRDDQKQQKTWKSWPHLGLCLHTHTVNKQTSFFPFLDWVK